MSNKRATSWLPGGTQWRLRLIAGCSLALLIAASGAAFAHGGGHGAGDHVGNAGDHFSNGGDQSSNGGHGRCIDCGAWTHGDGWGGDHYHHHHHRPATTGNPPPLHGPGSSHNPIVSHPLHGPGSSHNPIIAPAIRDHRTPQPRPERGRINPNCNQHNITGCEVRDHRTPPPTQCLGNLC